MAWLIGWGRRKSKAAVGSTAGAQTNYQLQLTVYKSVGVDTNTEVYLGTNVRDDFGDVRFTDTNGTTLLDYWIETLTSGVSAVIWIEIPSIPVSPSSTTIYIYYDNPAQTTTSSGTSTFIQWHGSTDTEFVDSLVVNPNNKFVFEAKARSTDSSALGDSFGVGVGVNAIWYLDSAFMVDDFNNGNTKRFIIYKDNVNVDSKSAAGSWTQDQWYKVKIINNITSASGYLDSTQIGTDIVGSLPTETLGIYMYEGGVHTGEQEYSFVRNYASPEPTLGATGNETTTATVPTLGSLYSPIQRGIGYIAGIGASLGRSRPKVRAYHVI